MSRHAPARKVKGGSLALLMAAERLFGAHGIDAVSMRQINAEAGMANKSAIAYHFGDKESLITAIYEYRLPTLDAIRGEMLSRAKLDGTIGEPRTLVAILALPLLQATDEEGRHSYLSFLHQALRSPVHQEGR